MELSDVINYQTYTVAELDRDKLEAGYGILVENTDRKVIGVISHVSDRGFDMVGYTLGAQWRKNKNETISISIKELEAGEWDIKEIYKHE